MKETPKSQELPIDEVDAQTLFFTIRELHRRNQIGVLLSAYEGIHILLEGGKWPGLKGEDTSSQTER